LLARDEPLAEENFAEPITTGCCRRHDLFGWGTEIVRG
jgi:hypothetical protein